MSVEPLPGEPAAIVETDGERLLAVADYHAGIEVGLRYEGVELQSAADERRDRLLSLVERSRPDRVIVLGDLGHAIGDPFAEEREELAALFEALSVPATLVKGNHDGDLEPVLADLDADVTVTPAHGVRMGSVGLVHGHTWPSPDVLAADVICMGHEHPVVRLEDSVGGSRKERAWLRGRLVAGPFAEHAGAPLETAADLVVFPAFNDRSGGTWINVSGQSFLAPFLPDALRDGEAFLVDGTRLGSYERV